MPQRPASIYRRRPIEERCECRARLPAPSGQSAGGRVTPLRSSPPLPFLFAPPRAEAPPQPGAPSCAPPGSGALHAARTAGGGLGCAPRGTGRGRASSPLVNGRSARPCGRPMCARGPAGDRCARAARLPARAGSAPPPAVPRAPRVPAPGSRSAPGPGPGPAPPRPAGCRRGPAAGGKPGGMPQRSAGLSPRSHWRRVREAGGGIGVFEFDNRAAIGA